MSQRVPTDKEIEDYARAIVLEGANQSDAWRKAFPQSEANKKTTHRQASKFSMMPNVCTRIEELTASSKAQSEEEFNITSEQKKIWLKKAVTLGLRLDDQGDDLPDPAPELAAISKPQISAAVAAIAELNRMDGDHAATKTDHTSSDGSMSPVWQVELVSPKSK